MPGEAEATEKSLVRTSLCKTPIPLHYLPMLHHTHPHKHRMLTPRYQKILHLLKPAIMFAFMGTAQKAWLIHKRR